MSTLTIRKVWDAVGLEELLRAGDTGYGVSVCHFVLHYRPAGSLDADVATLAALARPGGLLSITCPNEPGRILRTLTREGPGAARAELGRSTQRSHTFSHDSQKLSREHVVASLSRVGAREVDWMGVRRANEVLIGDDAKDDPAYFESLLDLERDLCRRDPFRAMGAMWQLTAQVA